VGLELGTSPYHENGFGGIGRHDGDWDNRRRNKRVCCGTAWFLLCIKCLVGQVVGGAIGSTCVTHGTYTWKGFGLTSEAKRQLGLAVYM